MAGSFFDSFNPTLLDIEASFSEDWTLNGATYPAIAIEVSSIDDHLIKGGANIDSSVRIIVRQEIMDQSGVKRGDVIFVRDTDMMVGAIESDGDASKTLVCVSKGVDVWRR